MKGLKALQSSDFRSYFAGQSISYIGNKLQLSALGWHAYELTGDPVSLGLIGFWRFLPILLLTLYGGNLVDRSQNQKKIMLLAQYAMGGLSLVLAYFSFTERVNVYHLYFIAGGTAAATAFDIPAKQAILPAIVQPNELNSAIRLNSLSSTIAEILGPALLGILVSSFSISMVYLLNALSFLGVILALFLMKSKPKGMKGNPKNSEMIVEGFHFLIQSPILLGILSLDFLASFFASGTTLLPVVSKEILGGDVTTYSLLTSTLAFGAVLASFLITVLPHPTKPGRAIVYSVIGYGLATVFLGLSSNLYMAIPAILFIGGGEILSRVLRDSLRQVLTPNPLRGRIGAINTLTSKSGPRLGELEAGVVAGYFGAEISLISGGILCTLTAIAYLIFHKPLIDCTEKKII